MITRFSVNLPVNELADLKALAEKQGSAMTQTLRQALVLQKLLSEEVDKGNKILIQQPDKLVREVIIR